MRYINRETNPQEWLCIWQLLTAILAGGEKEAPFTDKEIILFCDGYQYEGTDAERGHCFTKREESGRKHFIYIQDSPAP